MKIEDFFPPAKTFNSIGDLINTLVPNILVLSGVVFLFIIIFAGFQLIAAGQVNPEKWERTRNTLTYAVIGFIVIVIAYWIVTILSTVTGINIIEPSP